MDPFGIELLLDLKGCDFSDFTCEKVTQFFIALCDLIQMKRYGEPMLWEGYAELPHLYGISGVQFIETSNIVVHALPKLTAVYVNIFSCKSFDVAVAKQFTMNYWKATSAVDTLVVRH